MTAFKDALAAVGIRLPDAVALDRWAARLSDKPCSNTVTLVGLAAVLFYVLEKNRNPKVNDIGDALVYCSTCLSVGYGDIFARTPLGKVLGSALMTIGPALAAKTLDGPATERQDAAQQEILATLKQILSQLQGGSD
jgi:Ion channel